MADLAPPNHSEPVASPDAGVTRSGGGGRGEYCRECGEHTSQVGKLSARGRCTDCAAAKVEASIAEMADRSGPIYEKYRERVAAGLGLIAA